MSSLLRPFIIAASDPKQFQLPALVGVLFRLDMARGTFRFVAVQHLVPAAVKKWHTTHTATVEGMRRLAGPAPVLFHRVQRDEAIVAGASHAPCPKGGPIPPTMAMFQPVD